MSSNEPLLFDAVNGDLFTFDHGDYLGILRPSKNKLGLIEWVWTISQTAIRRSRNEAGEITEVKSEQVQVSEGYAGTAEEARRATCAPACAVCLPPDEPAATDQVLYRRCYEKIWSRGR